MRRRVHQALLRLIRAARVGNVLSCAIKVERAVGRQPLCEGGLTGELVGKLLLRGHFGGVRPGCLRQSVVDLQGRHSCLGAGLVGQIEQFPFGLDVIRR